MIPPSKLELQTAILEAIDESLTIFGVLGRKVIYQALEKRAQLRQEEIPQNIALFHRTLETILGTGSKPLEKQIAQTLYRKLGIEFTWHPTCTLIDYVNDLQQPPREPHL